MIRVRNFATGVNQDFPDAGAVSEMMELDPYEIEWAIEEYGRCDTNTHVAWIPSDEDGIEFPTAEPPQV
jgi:hypothetical protein